MANIDWEGTTRRYKEGDETPADTVEKLYKTHGTLHRVAQKLYVDKCSVSSFLKRHGRHVQKKGGVKTSKLDGIDFTGKTPYEVADEAGVSVSHVYRYVKINNIKTDWIRPAKKGKRGQWSRVAWHNRNWGEDDPNNEHVRGI